MQVSIYIHFPWCLQRCPYCDFATSATQRDAIPHQSYADAIMRELDLRLGQLPSNTTLCSVFVGGGTPSLWDVSALGQVLERIGQNWQLGADVEITVECNPSSLDADKAKALIQVGVNRLSVGVQSLNADQLKYLGRRHDGAGALNALSHALSATQRVSADLIFGLPGESPDGFVAHLKRVVELGISHVSAYALTIEEGTPFGALAKQNKLPLATEDAYAETYLAAEAYFSSQGFEHYEVSNYARPGARSLHNSHYWQGGNYLGLGAGAVGAISLPGEAGMRYRNRADALHYMAEPGMTSEVESLTVDERLREAWMLGLRTVDGVDFDLIEQRVGTHPVVGREKRVQAAAGRGDLRITSTAAHVPRERWLHLDGIVARVF